LNAKIYHNTGAIIIEPIIASTHFITINSSVNYGRTNSVQEFANLRIKNIGQRQFGKSREMDTAFFGECGMDE
jgi:hypothetical protein